MNQAIESPAAIETAHQDRQIRLEQEYLDLLFTTRDGELEQIESDIADTEARIPGDPGERVGQQARLTALARRRVELERATTGLCFGRIEEADGGHRYIGRIGLRVPDGETAAGKDPDDVDPLLIDWRAPIARTFYTATAARPLGLRSRRHIRTDGRLVRGVDDEILDGTGKTLGADGESSDLVGEAALIAALNQRRTGSMGDIVATLQAEQDEIIRAPHHGALVVQGGPGTGKTAVALHRAAYLLFSYPRLAERGVLVVGPSPAFLSYIDQVLPSLGETQVVSATPASLLPGVSATADDNANAAEIKGRAVWADVLARAVRARDPEPVALRVDYGGEGLTIQADRLAEILTESRAEVAGRHLAREVFRAAMLDELTQLVVDEGAQLLTDVEAGFEDILAKVDAGMARDPGVGARKNVSGLEVDGVATAADRRAIRQHLADDLQVARALDEVWPALDPAVVLDELWSDPGLLAGLAPELTDHELAAVHRTTPPAATGYDSASDSGAPSENAPSGSASYSGALSGPARWSAADIALLDEIADLVGAPNPSGPADLPAADSAADALARRAAADRTWTYGHVIVDEAQELSAMQWRMLLRRCPSRSFTVVGDVNQAEAPGSSLSWDEALAPVFGDRRRRVDLTVCYRTPHEVMARTEPVLRAAGSSVAPPRAVRSNGIEPWRRDMVGAGVGTDTAPGTAVAEAAQELADRYRGGRIAVIAPAQRCPALRSALDIGPGEDGSGSAGRPAEIVVIDPEESKGLEFDAVLIVDPHGIVERRRGWNALYVAMTRCTQELGVIALRPGPAELDLPVLR